MDWIKNILGRSTEDNPLSRDEEYPEILPVLPLKDAILLPNGVLPLIVSNPASISLI